MARADRQRPGGFDRPAARRRRGALEATGGFEVTVAAALCAALPLRWGQIRDFARATGRLAKTDTLDAQAIARFAEAAAPSRARCPTTRPARSPSWSRAGARSSR